MRLFNRGVVRQFGIKHQQAKERLERWMAVVDQADWRTAGDLRQTFPSPDKVGRHWIFNVGGNNYRVLATVDFATGIVIVQRVLTHAEYDRLDIKNL